MMGGGTTAAFRTLAAVTVAVCSTLLVVSDGNVAVALGPVIGGLLALAVWRLPIRFTAHAILFLALLVDNPNERPGRGLYKTILHLPGTFVYLPFEKSLKIPGFKATGIEVLFVVLAAIIGLRLLLGDRTDGGKERLPAAWASVKAALVALGGLVVLELWGLARGGNVNFSVLQARTMIFLPIMTLVFAYAFKRRQDLNLIFMWLVIVGVIRACIAIYYHFTFLRFHSDGGGSEGDGSYVTTHSDATLAAIVVVICIIAFYQNPTLRAFLFAMAVLPVVGLGMVVNNRRIAFVGVALGLFFSYLSGNVPFRRRVHQTILAVIPVGLIYTAVGWNARGGWAKPVQSLKSVILPGDTSSATRDIENYNLIQTLKRSPLVGSGFGHEYLEIVQAFDISGIFEAYKYVPHNSILWFWSVGGLVGFSAFWSFLVVGVFIATRTGQRAESNRQRVMCMTAVAAVAIYGTQSYGDMGLQSWMATLIVASTLGATASLAVRVGAWPAYERRRHSAPAAPPVLQDDAGLAAARAEAP